MAKDKYSMNRYAEFELRCFMQSLAYRGQTKKFYYDENKVLEIITNGSIKMDEWLKSHSIPNICDAPMVWVSLEDFEWILNEFQFDDIPGRIKTATKYGSCVLSIDKHGYKKLLAFLDVVIDPDKAMSNGIQNCCDILNEDPDTVALNYIMVPTLKGRALNNSAIAHMKLFDMPSVWDSIKAMFTGSLGRTVKLQKWLLKNNFIEPKKK